MDWALLLHGQFSKYPSLVLISRSTSETTPIVLASGRFELSFVRRAEKQASATKRLWDIQRALWWVGLKAVSDCPLLPGKLWGPWIRVYGKLHKILRSFPVHTCQNGWVTAVLCPFLLLSWKKKDEKRGIEIEKGGRDRGRDGEREERDTETERHTERLRDRTMLWFASRSYKL